MIVKPNINESEKIVLSYIYQNRSNLKFLRGIDFSSIFTNEGYIILKQILYNDIVDYEDELKKSITKNEFLKSYKNLVKFSFYKEVIKRFKENKLKDFEDFIMQYLFLYRLFDEPKNPQFTKSIEDIHIPVYYTREVFDEHIDLIMKYPTFFNLEDLFVFLAFYKLHQNDIVVIVDKSTIGDVKKILDYFSVKFLYRR